jgi:hypothetical protein
MYLWDKNAEVGDRFYEKHEYHALTSDQKNTLHPRRTKRGRVGKAQGRRGSGGKGGDKRHANQRNIAALDTKFNIPDDYFNEMSEDEEDTDASNHSNQSLTCHSKKNKGNTSLELNLSGSTTCLGSIGQMKELNRLDLDSHADACVVGKEALKFQDFDHMVTVSMYDPDEEKRSPKTVSATLGYVLPETVNTVLLIVYQGISLSQLDHNLLINMHMILHYFVLNETLKFQCLEETIFSHY